MPDDELALEPEPLLELFDLGEEGDTGGQHQTGTDAVDQVGDEAAHPLLRRALARVRLGAHPAGARGEPAGGRCEQPGRDELEHHGVGTCVLQPSSFIDEALGPIGAAALMAQTGGEPRARNEQQVRIRRHRPALLRQERVERRFVEQRPARVEVPVVELQQRAHGDLAELEHQLRLHAEVLDQLALGLGRRIR